MIQGTYDGDHFTITVHQTDFTDENDEPIPRYIVHRSGPKHRPWNVMLRPQTCDCPWYENKVDRQQGDIRDCVHVRALRSILKGVKDG